MDWLMGYLAVGLVMLVVIHLDSLEHANRCTDYSLWVEIGVIGWIVALWPAVFAWVAWVDYNAEGYVRARAARQAQDFKLYGC